MLTALRGNILELVRFGEYRIAEHGFLVLENGVIQGVFNRLPEWYARAAVTDYGEQIITQAFSDMHLHAPQYAMMGMGLDLPLLDWLSTYTFKTESRFQDAAFARRTYARLARALVENGTTRVVMFSSIHREATVILMEELERAGITGYVGKVNMDRNGAPYLQETTEESKLETLRWLDECDRFTGVRPILTPRFTPSCTNELMSFLGALASERSLFVQSHLSENLAEIQLVKNLRPDCEEYWETYDRCGLFGDKTVMAHCVHSSDREMAAMRDHGVYAAHCPDSNINISSGFPAVKKLIRSGVNVVLGSDVAGGAELAMNRVITSAIRMSNAVRISSGWREPSLTVAEAAYLATSAPAKYFGFGPGFTPGDRLHALVLNDDLLPEPTRTLSVAERYERLLYLMTKEQIAARYAEGKLLA